MAQVLGGLVVRLGFATLLPQLEDDEHWLRAAEADPQTRPLAQAMRTEARAMTATVYPLVAATAPCEAVAATQVLHTLLAAHIHHEELLASALNAGGTDTADR